MKARINAIFSATLLLIAVPTIQAMKPVGRVINSTKKQLSTLANAVQRAITGETPTNVVIAQLNTPPSNPLSNPNESDFYRLDPSTRAQIIFLLSQFASSNNLASIGEVIRALAQVNSELNTLINSPRFYHNMSRNLAVRFEVSNEEVAKALRIDAAKKELDLQQHLRNLCFNTNRLNEIQIATAFLQLARNGVDLNFIYKDRKFPLIIAIPHNPTLAFLLIEKGVNLNMSDGMNNRPLKAAEFLGNDELVTAIKEKLNQKK